MNSLHHINNTTSQAGETAWVCVGHAKVQDRVEKIAREVFLIVRKEDTTDRYAWLNDYKVFLSLTREPVDFKDASILGSIGCHIDRIPKEQGIFISTLSVNHKANNGQYRGIGTVLMQAAMELSWKLGREGCICLTPFADSPPFYYNLGMRVMRVGACEEWEKLSREDQEKKADEHDARIKNTTEKWGKLQWDSMKYQDALILRMTEAQDLTKRKMYLPDSEIKKWEAKIQKSPVLLQDLNMQNYFQSL